MDGKAGSGTGLQLPLAMLRPSPPAPASRAAVTLAVFTTARPHKGALKWQSKHYAAAAACQKRA